MKKINKFKVVPYLPEKLKPLLKIANNLWWVWNVDAIDLFRRLDLRLWSKAEHNPIKFLSLLSQKVLDEAAESDSFLSHMHMVESELDRHLERESWYDRNREGFEDAKIAYFSAEFGLHECVPIYSGGLGILAGDHLKSSSELGIPLYGMGLLYRLGYFRQYLNLDGWQQEKYPELDFYNMPISSVHDDAGNPLVIDVDFPNGKIYAKVWKLIVGRVVLFLLDTNIDLNKPEDRAITDQLYGGDSEMRVKQEILLGMGGVRAFKKMGLEITVFHMNEGHAAFLAVERIYDIMQEKGLNFDQAHTYVTESNVFTTHTPVPAGNDRFEPELIEKYFSHLYLKLGITSDRFMALGRENPFDKKESFCMTVLAMKTAAGVNGVSKLHGNVSRNMWKNTWQEVPEGEIPIEHITNGIQTLSWTSDEMMILFNRYLGPAWIDNPTETEVWQSIDSIPDSELWRCRERLRERLVAFSREKLRKQLRSRGASPKQAEIASSVLDPDALTIGFARRFATYKRANLIFRDLDRLYRILSSKDRPVQIVFSGKAHPKDNLGKEIIKNIIHLSRDEKMRKRIVFLEDYDIKVARYMVHGVDIWLNNPIRPKEASGTSGMKVVPNGGLNISVLDGWWDEAYNTKNGWAIGSGEVYDDDGYQNEVESLAIYDLLEDEVIPQFYNRGYDGLPNEWLARIRESMKSLIPEFNTNRMVKDYAEKFYMAGHGNFRLLGEDNFQPVKSAAIWKDKIRQHWDGVKVLEMDLDIESDITVGDSVNAHARIDLGKLSKEDVLVELYFGALDSFGEIQDGVAKPMEVVSDESRNIYRYEGQILCLGAGKFGYSVRIVPLDKFSVRKFDPELPCTWA